MTYRRFPWGQVFKALAEKYQFTDEQIGRLTMYRALILCGAYSPEFGRVQLNADQSKQWKG